METIQTAMMTIREQAEFIPSLVGLSICGCIVHITIRNTLPKETKISQAHATKYCVASVLGIALLPIIIWQDKILQIEIVGGMPELLRDVFIWIIALFFGLQTGWTLWIVFETKKSKLRLASLCHLIFSVFIFCVALLQISNEHDRIMTLCCGVAGVTIAMWSYTKRA